MDTMVSIWWVWLSAAIALAVLAGGARGPRPRLHLYRFRHRGADHDSGGGIVPHRHDAPRRIGPVYGAVAGGMDRAEARVQKPKHRHKARDPGHQ